MSLDQRVYVPGSETDFDELYRATYPRMLRSVGAITRNWPEAEDCVQEAYSKAFSAWSRWDPRAPAEAWLWRIVMNTTYSRHRQGRRFAVWELLKHVGRPPASTDPAQVEMRSDLAGALRHLKPREMSAVVLRHMHGYSNIEIAEFLGVDVRTVTRLLTKGLERLRHQLGDSWQEPAAALGGSA